MLVTTPRSDEVWLFDAATRRELGRVKTPSSAGSPGQPFGVAWSPDGSRAFVTLRGAQQVAVVHVPSMTVSGYIGTGAGPDGVAFVRRSDGGPH